MRRSSPCIFVGLLFFVALPFVTAAAQIPAPATVLGHNPGDDFYLADYDDAIKYFHALAASSDRIQDVQSRLDHARRSIRDCRHLLA